MKLILAEKPSVARDISRVIGVSEKCRLNDLIYFKNSQYIVTSARGHLAGLSEPDEYNPAWGKPWRLEVLPICPLNWTLKANSDCIGLLHSLRELMNSREVDSIICATDAEREGEVIFRYIYDYVGCRKPYERLWVSSLTDESIRNGMNNLLSGQEKYKLYEAGYARNRIDWLWGLNLSRFYSILYNQTLSVGRVQTPTVYMIVQRDREIAGFVKKPYFTLMLENGAAYYTKDGENNGNTFAEKENVERVKAVCLNKNAVVTFSETKEKSQNRPLLYSLTSLQKEANEKHGFSAARTLVTAQDLYEKKLLTYPRTDSNHITEDMQNSVTQIAELLAFHSGEQVGKLFRQGLNLDKRVVNNDKVSDHHAIIPTEEITKMSSMNLTPDEKIITDMVIRRFLTALDRPYIYNESESIFEVEGHYFRLLEKTPVSLGFKQYHREDEDDESVEDAQVYNVGDSYFIHDIILEEKETVPLKPFTESSLLSAMENIDRRIEDKDKKQYVKKRGLGTPATRAAIIERVIKMGYIKREKKNIVSTDTGRIFIDLLPEEVKSAELTADMEEILAGIESGAVLPGSALVTIMELITRVIHSESGKVHEKFSALQQNQAEVLGLCPKCGGNVTERQKSFSCHNSNDCGFIMWKEDDFWLKRKKKLTAKIVKDLLLKDKVLVKGLFSEKTGNTYDAFISLGEWTGKDEKVRVAYIMMFPERK